jgi:hypothetical protein
MNQADERYVDPIQEMTRIASNSLDLAAWGFRESYRSSKSGMMIYDSEWCRISLTWSGWDYLSGNSMSIRYGRLHAPNERIIMTWNNSDCRCWHRVEHALHFLDNRPPTEVAKLNYSHPIIRPFHSDEVRQEFAGRQPEWLAQIHVTIWRNYGHRLFELFDLRQPDLWKQYQEFLKQVYDIAGRNPAIKPPLDKVC